MTIAVVFRSYAQSLLADLSPWDSSETFTPERRIHPARLGHQ
jgi:hypothetical protein